MVHITEMRVPLPMSVEDFKRGQRYGNWKTNEENTVEGQGGQLISIAPYVSEGYGEGIFTHSLYRLGDRLPDWVTKLVPASALVIDEKTWMAYPHTRTVLTVPFFHKLKIEMITLHENDDGSTENIHGLSEAELAIRKVDMVDIVMDKVAKRDYQAKLDPQLFKSSKTGLGPLRKDWQYDVETIMCAYKLVRVEANYWGVQNRLEKLMLNGVRQIVLLTHRNAFCYIDEWYDLTYEEICRREDDGRKKLRSLVKQPPIIDPNTGLELFVDTQGDLQKVASGSDNDSEAEFFEATMEWVEEDEEYGQSHISEVSMEPCSLQLPLVSDSCAICQAKTSTNKQADVLCQTCDEYFCQDCFAEFHVTPRLQQHVRQSSTIANASKPAAAQMSSSRITSIREEKVREDDLSDSQASPMTDSEVISNYTSRSQLANLDIQNLHQRGPSWLEEIHSSFEDIHVSSAPNSKVRSKSSYRILNSLPDYSLEDSQEFAPVSSKLIGAYTHHGLARKRLSVRPNELSEEMVRSISLLYLRYAETQEYSNVSVPSRQCLPYVRKRSRSFSSAYSGPEPLNTNQRMPKKVLLLNPYGVQPLWDIGSYSACAEVKFAPEEDKLKEYDALYRHFSAGLFRPTGRSSSYEMTDCLDRHENRALVESLQHVDPRDMGHEQRLSFWINVYNALMMHSAYIVGGHLFSALAIEHSILRACSYRPALASLLPVQKYKKHDARHAYALDRPEPLVSFALCCGSYSAPMVRIYTARNVRTQMQEACRDFLLAHIRFTRHKRVVIPKILQWYARDFSHSAKSLLEWVALQLPEEKRAQVEDCLTRKKGKRRLTVVTYNWSFRYLMECVGPTANRVLS